MAIAPGSRLGPYEILSSLGAGGMGEVWSARDPRLGREVAIKVLPEDLSSDRERLKRFEREARAASAPNHPNIVTIHEIGEADGRAFLVMERIEGQTLRELILEGPLPARRLLSIATQAADGLARAHETGIVHRDLKPENLMVTKDGLVKILDFGLAKVTLRRPLDAAGREQTAAEQHPMAENSLTAIPTVSGSLKPTTAGTVLGTVGYMSPEQASGKPFDYRSDQFSLGVILYEMATGRRAFRKDTPLETLSAILRDDPEPIGTLNPQTPAPLRWIVERCLAKNPEERYVSTRDLARDLASVRDHLSDTTVPAESLQEPPRTRRLLWPLLAGIPLLAAVAIASFLLGAHAKKTPPPSFHRLTFRRGHIWSARFTPDGQTVVYGAAWDGKPVQIFSTRPGNPESVPLSLPSADFFGLARGRAGHLSRAPQHRHVGDCGYAGARSALGKRSSRDPRKRRGGRLEPGRLEPRPRSRRGRSLPSGVSGGENPFREPGMDQSSACLSKRRRRRILRSPRPGRRLGSNVGSGFLRQEEGSLTRLVQRAGSRLVSRGQGDLVHGVRSGSHSRSPRRDSRRQ